MSGRPRGGRGHERREETRRIAPDIVVLYGWHPVREALQNPARRLRRLLATENALRRLQEERVELGLAPEIVRPGEIDRLLTPDAVHQGLYLEADPLAAPAFGDLGPNDVVLVLDQITDPHNVGAIVRSAAAFAVAAILTTERHSPAATGVLAKAASGGLEHVPIVHVRNLGDTLDEMGANGVLRVGLDSEGAAVLDETPLRGPLALVLGAEDKGLRVRTRSLCDALARLDMPGAIKSLNVSNAAALALYVARRALPPGGRRP
ncbi:TrmH family RNA methyltransferase [Labrys wisconsinensis]|uniref:23S rRNA (Guanosine2251-2'-O)-methyltransferase n=1 Tax=Labrys wisconsinensis TaxID=425677 RepID=A0ABU0J8Y9_9HYPH|nr:RNA methyltransferase [Labrys wisconsinensis]MDQ0470738.1 23S rRNA (guanosine2251-2'-O)-methyltransferase [Labrys wisconsinensis]